MTCWMKKGVLGYLHPILQKAQGKIETYYAEAYGYDFFMTSVEEANHAPGSFHYIGYAFDFKRQGVSLSEIRNIVGSDFDILEYSNGKGDFFHIEYDIWDWEEIKNGRKRNDVV